MCLSTMYAIGAGGGCWCMRQASACAWLETLAKTGVSSLAIFTTRSGCTSKIDGFPPGAPLVPPPELPPLGAPGPALDGPVAPVAPPVLPPLGSLGPAITTCELITSATDGEPL